MRHCSAETSNEYYTHKAPSVGKKITSAPYLMVLHLTTVDRPQYRISTGSSFCNILACFVTTLFDDFSVKWTMERATDIMKQCRSLNLDHLPNRAWKRCFKALILFKFTMA